MEPATSLQPSAKEAALADPRSFLNRELSNLAFIERVLEEASDPQVPLLERLRFLAILSVSLDELFMIRVAGLKQQLTGHVEETGPDAMSPSEQLQALSQRCHALVERQDPVPLEGLPPAPEKAGVRPPRGARAGAPPAAPADFFPRR